MSVASSEVDKPSKEEEEAIDSLHTLPLSIIPLETPGLRKAYMIKNARLETVIELFKDGTSGSGQIAPNELAGFFHDEGGRLSRDILILEKLMILESFDVYSLRIQLRNLDIGFEEHEALNLSPSKRAELTEYMRTFTRPLIQRVYGESQDIEDVSQIIAMLVRPNREEAMKQLKMLAKELGISLSEVPTFLERYGDIFLSLSYFRNCLDQLMSEIPAFLNWMGELKTNYQVTNDPNQLKNILQIEEDLNEISTSIVGRFEFFDLRSRDFWDDINAEAFQEFRDLITAHHVSIGAVLCGLAVKMALWNERFPARAGGPVKRLEFVNSEIRPGLRHIKQIEQKVGSIG